MQGVANKRMLNIDNICEHTFIGDYLSNDSIVVDLGVNHGGFSKTIIEKYGCIVYGAEPVPNLFYALPTLSQLHAYPLAITSYEGSINICINPTRCASTMLLLAEDGGRNVEVKCTTLDLFLSNQVGTCKIDLLKMDIEGAEIKVLMTSSEETLKEIAMLTVEFHDFLDCSLTPEINAIHRRMEGLGFYVYKFSLDNSDVLYVNRSKYNLTLFQRASIGVVKYLRGIKRVVNRSRR